MSEQNERRMFGRRRRANVPQDRKRDRRYEVSVNQDEDVQLQARAIAAGVTVPRFLFESAMSAHVETDTDRKAAVAELFKLRRDMAGVATNVNQLAKWANEERAFPADAESVVAEYRAVVAEIRTALDRINQT
jgi:ABC-type Fe3+-hydroxamate transport system substrate-binding protein